MIFSRLLALVGPEADADSVSPRTAAPAMPAWRSNLYWFRLFMFSYAATRAFVSRDVEEPIGALHALLFDGLGRQHAMLLYEWLQYAIAGVCAVGFISRYAMIATRIVAALVFVHMAVTFPFTANHVFLEWLILLLLALLDERREPLEAELLLQALRWLVAVFFFYTGLQKLLYGYYFQGEFLSFLTATEQRFADFFRYVISTPELARLQALGGFELGAGPYRADSLSLKLISNGTYVFEMMAGIALVVPRARMVAALAGIAFVIMIELAAREVVFGLLTVNLLLLFLPRAWNRTLFPLFAAIYLYLIAVEVEIVSPWFRYYG